MQLTARQYQNRIKKQMEELGTYKAEFSFIIEHLAKMLSDYDEIEAEFEKYGKRYVTSKVGKGGIVTQQKNQYYKILEELRGQMIIYARDLGLTPKGLEALGKKSMDDKPKSKLDKILSLYA